MSLRRNNRSNRVTSSRRSRNLKRSQSIPNAKAPGMSAIQIDLLHAIKDALLSGDMNRVSSLNHELERSIDPAKPLPIKRYR
jgi:hypothetical protein